MRQIIKAILIGLAIGGNLGLFFGSIQRVIDADKATARAMAEAAITKSANPCQSAGALEALRNSVEPIQSPQLRTASLLH